MIFTPDMLELIRTRRKTQTREPATEPVCRYQVGRVYQAQPGHGQKGQLELTILGVRQEPFGEISVQDVRREGFVFTKDFQAAWEREHGPTAPDTPVWVIMFAVGDLRERFDRPRLLKATPGRSGITVEEHQDYTAISHLAMGGNSDPGEGLSEQELKPYVAEAHQRDRLRRLVPAHGSLARITEEIETLRASLGEGGRVSRDVHRDLVSLERARAQLERKLAS